MDVASATQVAIVGAGPAGSLLAHLLLRAGVDCQVVERQPADHVLGRIRAGVLEHGSAETLTGAGLGERLAAEGFRHTGVHLAMDGQELRIDLEGLTGRHVVIYGQTEVQKDLYSAIGLGSGRIVFEAEDVAVHGVDGDQPHLTFTLGGAAHRIDAKWIVGCDGFHGPSRGAIPPSVVRTYERVYPFGWLGVLSETPPVRDELVYASSPDGFALCSMRHERLSRYYVQCPVDTQLADWPDDHFWEALKRRLPDEVAADLVTGPSIEKSIAPLRSFVAEPMRHGRLLLAGDAAHIVPPTGAKGLNLAISDVVLAAEALIAAVKEGSTTAVDAYSATALRGVWQAVRFSWWMTRLLHRFHDDHEDFDHHLSRAEFDQLTGSEAARQVLAENYVGLRR